MKAKRYTNCIVCGKEKMLPKQTPPRAKSPLRSKPSKSKSYVDPLVYERDPYCSRICAEADLAEKTKETAA